MQENYNVGRLSFTGHTQAMISGSHDETADTAHRTRENAAVEQSILMRDNQIDSRDLFLANREITIVHGAETYRLRLTSQNKLILTK
jgi:hemin uptake protein HemP